MCVKEFLGYNCGHCSVPILRQCPLSASNPQYPVCKFPAERPIFTNEYCHPCSRVVWNIKVLKDEEEHRARHLAGECMCEVIFEGEEREKHMRTRGKGKGGKGRGKDAGRGEQGGFGGNVEHRGHGGYGGHVENGGQGVLDHGAFEQQVVEGEPGGFGRGRHDIEEVKGMELVLRIEENNNIRQDWEPEAQMAAYEYVGYYVDDGSNGNNQGTDPEQTYAMEFGGQEHGQLPMGQTGSGMKWYPQEQHYPQLNQLPQLSPLTTIYHNTIQGTPRGSRATSEPIGIYDHPRPVAQVEFPIVIRHTQPMVVSSDMMRSESS